MKHFISITRLAAASRAILNTWWGKLALCLCFTLGMIYHYVIPLNAILFNGWMGGNDCYQMIWNLWFVNESVTSGHNPYVSDLIYYPQGARLSHHSLAAGYFPITFLVKLVTGGDPMYPVYAYRIIILIAFTLILYFSYLFLREVGASRWAAVTAAVAYAFCDFYILHAQHINHLAGFFIPLCALLLVRACKRPRSWNVVLFAMACGVAVYFTEFALYIYVAAWLFVLLFKRERATVIEKIRSVRSKMWAIAALSFILIAAPFVWNFIADKVVTPAFAEAAYFSANLLGFVIPGQQSTPLYGSLFEGVNSRMTTGLGGTEVFVGFPLLLFAVIALLRARNRYVWICCCLALFFFLLALGPTLKVLGTDTGIRLPYAVLGKVPPFNASRTPVRFIVVGLFFLMTISAWGMTAVNRAVARQYGPRIASVVMALALLWTVAEVYSPIARQPAFVPPGQLAKIVDGPVLNLTPSHADGYAALLQVFHHQPLGTGYLARITEQRIVHMRDLRELFDQGGPSFCEKIKKLGFRNLVLTPYEMAAPYEWSSMQHLELSKCDINVVDLRSTPAQDSVPNPQEWPHTFPSITKDATVAQDSPEVEDYLWYGWGSFEPHARWTTGRRAAIAFAVDEKGPLEFRVRMRPFLEPGLVDAQRVSILLNGHQIGTITLTAPEPRDYSFTLPAELLRDRNMIEFLLPDSVAPHLIGKGDDGRMLGVYVHEFAFQVTE